MTGKMVARALAALGMMVVCTACPRSPGETLPAAGARPGKMKMATEIPRSLLTPPKVDTRLGALEFFDGYPAEATVKKVYDHLLFMRGVQAFLSGIPAASLEGMRRGLESVGAVDSTVGIFETLMDSRSLFLTPNTESIYAVTWLDLKQGPVVVESPPNVLGFVDDAWFNYVADMGNAGPDRGQGGKFLFLPPGYKGEVPEGYYTYRSATHGNWAIWRGFLVKGSPRPAVRSMKKHLRIYPLAQKDRPPKQKFVNLSGKFFNTIHANTYKFYEEVDAVIQREPAASGDPEIKGLFASIGIEKGKKFAPDAAARKTLDEAAVVANATARAIVFAGRDKRTLLFKDSAWKTGFIGGSHEFLVDGVRLLDARTLFFYYATGITPAMATQMVGVGSQYAGALVDSAGARLDGGRTYKLTLPPDVPVKDFWSVVLYDNQTRSMLQTDQKFPSLNSQRGVKKNRDGSTDLYLGPKAPRGKRSNWIQTVPGKGWTLILRLYGPLQPWFDRTWQPGEITPMTDIPAVAPGDKKYKMATEIPADLLTPDTVQTRLGPLQFVDGFPTRETVQKVYDNLDFIRGVEAFLSAMPGASQVAIRQGFRDLGIKQTGAVSITETLMNARALYLTANTESIYAGSWLDLSKGPVVVESPPNTLGMVNDFFFRYVADLGNAGPDRGKGGKYLFLPPGHKGQVPEGYHTFRSPTFNNILFWRGFTVNGDPGPAVESIKATTRIYPLDRPEQRDQTTFTNSSGVHHNTIHANDFSYYRELLSLVADEPASAYSPEILGLLAAIGIQKDAAFDPDERMTGVLTDAVAVGNATARALTFHKQGHPRAEEALIYGKDSAWFTFFLGGSHDFSREGARLLEARTMFFYPAIAVSPAMAIKRVGLGSQYAAASQDSGGAYLDGSKTYRLTLPGDIPAKDFWSIVIYDPQTRSLLQTDQAFPSLNSQRAEVPKNADGTTEIYFSPTPPPGKEKNWIQTAPGKGWFTLLRLYGPLQPWFDKTWRPGEVELVQ